jgi:hypothetical protein
MFIVQSQPSFLLFLIKIYGFGNGLPRSLKYAYVTLFETKLVMIKLYIRSKAFFLIDGVVLVYENIYCKRAGQAHT